MTHQPPQEKPKQVALIGAGRFIEETVLPSFLSLPESYEVTQIITRSGKLRKPILELVDIEANSSVDELYKNIDVIFISVPQEQVSNVISNLLSQKVENKTILFTTPVAPLANLPKLRRLKKSNQLLSFEFLPLHPAYLIVQSLINNNFLGKLAEIQLVHCGYLYHGLATIKMLAGARELNHSKYNKSLSTPSFSFSFSGDLKAQMVEPKNYEKGYFVVKGDKASITSKKATVPNKTKHTFQKVVNKDGVLTGYQILGNELALTYVQELNEKQATFLLNKPIYKQEFLIASTNYLLALANEEFDGLHQIEESLGEHWQIRLSRLNSKMPFGLRLPERVTLKVIKHFIS